MSATLQEILQKRAIDRTDLEDAIFEFYHADGNAEGAFEELHALNEKVKELEGWIVRNSCDPLDMTDEDHVVWFEIEKRLNPNAWVSLS